MSIPIQEIEQLIKRLPPDTLKLALEYLRALEKEDGVWEDIKEGHKHFLPYDRVKLTSEEKQILAEAEAEIQRGEGIGLDELRKKYGV